MNGEGVVFFLFYFSHFIFVSFSSCLFISCHFIFILFLTEINLDVFACEKRLLLVFYKCFGVQIRGTP